MNDLIRELTEAFGPSGSESNIRRIIQERIQGVVDDLHTDALGNLIAHKKASSHIGVPTHRLMIAGHMDEIGLVVSHLDDKGFLRFQVIGGVSPLTLLGGRVGFADGALGVIGREKPDSATEFPTIDKMYIDVGAVDRASLTRRVGDVAAFVRPFASMGKRLVAKAMDDRIGCAVMVQALLEMPDSPHELYFVFTVQEEVGLRGATTSSFGVEPRVAIAVDVTLTGDTPEAHPNAVSLGNGPAIKVKDGGMLAHPGVKDWMVRTAEAAQIPYQLEVLERGTTDARAMQLSRAGVAAGVISIPCRYVHSPSEVVDQDDVTNGVRLLKSLLQGPVNIE